MVFYRRRNFYNRYRRRYPIYSGRFGYRRFGYRRFN